LCRRRTLENRGVERFAAMVVASSTAGDALHTYSLHGDRLPVTGIRRVVVAGDATRRSVMRRNRVAVFCEQDRTT